MAKKIIYSTEQDVPEMKLTEKEKKELNQAWKEIMDDAKKVVDDYVKNPSEMDSGSVITIHEDSPFLDESLKGNRWQKVTKGSFLSDVTEKKEEKSVVKKKKK